MIEYPNIPQEHQEFTAHLFDKLDGNNLRTEWTRKRGFHKFGTRHRLFDETDLICGAAKTLFLENNSERMNSCLRSIRDCQKATVFFEYWGRNSFCGIHNLADEMLITVFDIYLDKTGFLAPKDFLHACDRFDIPRPKYLGQLRWTRGLVEKIRLAEPSQNCDWYYENPILEGAPDEQSITFEGVVGKSGGGLNPIMAKAKTQVWKDKVINTFAECAGGILSS